MQQMTSLTLSYSSTRQEVATFYWRTWRTKLWKVHVFYFMVVLLSVLLAGGKWPPSPSQAVYGLLVASCVILLLFLFPQIMFKPQVRTIIFDVQGINTTVGKKSGSVKWKEVQSIEDTADHIVICRKNLNAFLVPRRAFHSDEERESVLTTIREWMNEQAAL